MVDDVVPTRRPSINDVVQTVDTIGGQWSLGLRYEPVIELRIAFGNLQQNLKQDKRDTGDTYDV